MQNSDLLRLPLLVAPSNCDLQCTPEPTVHLSDGMNIDTNLYTEVLCVHSNKSDVLVRRQVTSFADDARTNRRTMYVSTVTWVHQHGTLHQMAWSGYYSQRSES